jgi:hypothetical protein
LLKILNSEKANFRDTATNWLHALKSQVEDKEILKQRGWPKRPGVLGKMFRDLEKPLRSRGVYLKFDRDPDDKERTRYTWATRLDLFIESPEGFSESSDGQHQKDGISIDWDQVPDFVPES